MEYKRINSFLSECSSIIDKAYVITKPHAQSSFLVDWRKQYTGKACAILCPSSTKEASDIVATANKYDIPLVIQGGNTGHSGGAIPDISGLQAVLSTRRLRRIRSLDLVNNTITIEAGCLLSDIQITANASKRLFPLRLGSYGSCTIGGNLATNAGGVETLRYGNARALCLGLEVIVSDAQIWDGLRTLRKDNTGYDLRDLFIGSEGTLGIITAAVLKLYPMPIAKITALATVLSLDHAIRLLSAMRMRADPLLTSFELISWNCLELIKSYFPKLALSLPSLNHLSENSFFILIELSDQESEMHGRLLLEEILLDSMNNSIISDATVAQSVKQSKIFWEMRECIPLAQARAGLNVKHDISLPISEIGEFIASTDHMISSHWPGTRTVIFGHLGDGNLHYNVQAPIGVDTEFFRNCTQISINRLVYDQVHSRGGSISAEHGIGQLKIADMVHYKSKIELTMMHKIKNVLDPDNRFNPGKVLKNDSHSQS